MVSGKKRTPHGSADPNGSQKMSHTKKYKKYKKCLIFSIIPFDISILFVLKQC